MNITSEYQIFGICELQIHNLDKNGAISENLSNELFSFKTKLCRFFVSVVSISALLLEDNIIHANMHPFVSLLLMCLSAALVPLT